MNHYLAIMKLHIEPISFQIDQTISQIHIQVISIHLFQGATIRITYYKDDGHLCTYHNFPTEITLTPQQYQSWGEDDQFIISQILEQVGLVSIPPPVIEDPMEPDEPTPLE